MNDIEFIPYDPCTPLPKGLVGQSGPGNTVLVHKDFSSQLPLQLSFNGTGNIIRIGADCHVEGVIHAEGSNNRVDLGSGRAPQRIAVTIYDDSTFLWGDGCTAYQARFWVHGGKTCRVGDGALLSEGIQIRTTDHHSVIDLNTMTQINFPADVIIGERVWIGEGVSIAKGVTIGNGSILSAKAFVNRDVPANEMWAGIPARCVRKTVSWVNSHPASPDDISWLNTLNKTE